MSSDLRIFLKLLLAITVLHSLSGCNADKQREASAPVEINVAAAANLSDAFLQIQREFTNQCGIKVVYNFASTADLAKQIENGAPFDVFASADVVTVDRL